MKKNNDNHQKEGKKQWQTSKRRNKTKKMKQITNSEVKTDPVVDDKPVRKHNLAELDARVMEAPLL